MSQAGDDEAGPSGTQAAEDVSLSYQIFGRFRTEVVGVRYYTGYANKNEMVKLTREPNNPYDKWAIRVDNQHNDKIGHIKREQACHLSPLMDRGELLCEGYVQGEKGAYTMPIDIICFGLPQNQDAVVKRLRLCNMTLAAADPEDLLAGAEGGADAAGPSAATNRLSAAQMEQSLERMFDEVMSTQSAQHMDPDGEVLSQLFPHQKVALAWMVQRENSSQLPPFWEVQETSSKKEGKRSVYCNTLTNFMSPNRPEALRGGLLADDMGLGKTLVVISLVATNRPGVALPAPYLDPGAWGRGGDDEDGDGDQPGPSARRKSKGKGKIKEEKEREKGKGKRKSQQVAEEDSDVEIVAEVPASKKRKSAGGAAVPSPQGAGSLTQEMLSKVKQERQTKADKLAKERAALAAALEPPPKPPAPGGPSCTLIVCPLSVLSNWLTQVEEHTAGNLKVYQYHGPSRNRSPAFLAQHDLVVTTYATLSQDLPAGGATAKTGLLAVSWLRVVLDEAHNIKNANSLQSKAAAAVKAERRWAVTGTPIQNKLDDLFGFLSFLKLEPLNERQYFTRTLARPIKAHDVRGLMKLQLLMHSIALRRTKAMRVNGRPLVSLPSKTVHLVQVHLHDADKKAYDRLELEGRKIISHMMEQDLLLANYMSVLEIILRLRQVCDASSLVPEGRLLLKDLAAAATAGKPLDADQLKRIAELLAEGGDDGCSICLGAFTQPAVTPCGHVYCRLCIESVIAKAKPACPLCRAAIKASDLIDAPTPQGDGPSGQESASQQQQQQQQPEAGAGAKVEALIARLLANRQGPAVVDEAGCSYSASQAAAAGGAVKSVVFSQFLGMLDLVQAAMSAAGVRFARLDGSTSAKARADMLTAFASRAPGSPEVMLVSLRAGGVGMNLTSASQVHLLDPWWNPAVEEQAMDRVHRLGQTRPVEVFRYIARDTIEERMLQLQERKRQLASSAFERRRPEDGRAMRIDDVRLLMSL